jgi:flavin-dependent dehydrogenase
MLAARAGHRVLVLERDTYPADKLSTLYIQPPGVARLAEWGLLDRVEATGCPPLRTVNYRLGEVALSGRAAAIGAADCAYAPRRHLLDAILAEAAAEAGAEVRHGAKVAGLVEEDGRVVGVRFLDGGAESVVRAHIVAGADGMRSTVAEAVGAGTTLEHPRLTCAYYGFWEGVEAEFELYEGEDGWVSAVPTNGAVLVSAYFPQDEFDRVRADAEARYLDNVRRNAPDLWKRLEPARRVERLYGTGDQRNFFRTASGPGWVLVGDAGHHKDSLTARGIGDAFEQSVLLVEHLDGTEFAAADVDARLERYEKARDAALMESYQSTLLVAEASARMKRKALIAAVGTSEELTRRYFDAVAGVRPVADLYGPELQAALASVAGQPSE